MNLQRTDVALPGDPDSVALGDLDGVHGDDNDTITARDRTRDAIDCGAGRDKVKADRSDTVKNCEFVTRR